MIAYREWRLEWSFADGGPVLKSKYRNFHWLKDVETADEVPDAPILVVQGGGKGGGFTRVKSLNTGVHGIYAWLSWSNHSDILKSVIQVDWLPVVGVIEVFGKIMEHTDGVVRAEHARVLALRIEIGNRQNTCGHMDYWRTAYTPLSNNPDKGLVPLNPCCTWKNCSMPLATEGIEAGKLAVYALPDLEHMLLQRYEVPRFERGEGPWEPPIGAGPTYPPREAK